MYRSGGSGGWEIRSIVNKFSVFSRVGEPSKRQGELGTVINGIGQHEVIIESPHHNGSVALYTESKVESLLTAYRHRFREFYSDPRIEHVIVFKNHGSDAGASQQHPHSQIVGTPMVPGQVLERVESYRRFHSERKTCVACDMIKVEEREGTRIVEGNDRFVAFIPYAALSPFHLWIFPRNHSVCFGNLSDRDLKSLSGIFHRVLKRFHFALNNPAFNMVIRSLGPRDEGLPFFHWYISFIPRVNKAAGFELGTGMYVNSASPEKNAEFLRDFQLP